MLIDTNALGTVIELSHEMARGMPNHVSHPEFNLVPYYRLGDFELDDGYWGCNELLLMSGHSGTHLDAIGHVATHGAVFGGVPAADAQRGIDGLGAHGIEQAPAFVRRGVLLDVAGHRGADIVDPAEAVTRQDLEDVAGAAGVEITTGDCVLVRTGWAAHWTDPAAYMGGTTGTPGIDVAAARWLADLGASVVGGETAVVEHHPAGGTALPVHQELLAGRGVHLLENMDLGGLRGVTTFLFLCLPLRIRGASGSPVRPVAIVAGEKP
ncbi:cyclase family protein [Actinomadura formosensis]|uniref:cyclase family protein n=1 Tax=Actinomadura formosensis TaxID=60706 RepID=UPI00082D8CBA|nr:cyclase family protein [Actinomadura formosensis]